MSDADAVYGPSLVKAIGSATDGRVTFVGPNGAYDVSCDDPEMLLNVLATGLLTPTVWLLSDTGVAFRLNAMYTASVSTPTVEAAPAPGGS